MDAMHVVIGAVFFVIVIVIGICASEKKVTVQFKNPETGNILYSGKGNSVASALLDGFDKMYRNLSTNSHEETLENRLATMKQAMEDNRHYLKKRDVEVCKEYIQKVQSLLTQKEQERKQLGIPLIIVPNPATSSPPTRISRKSAIQAHCLHAK